MRVCKELQQGHDEVCKEWIYLSARQSRTSLRKVKDYKELYCMSTVALLVTRLYRAKWCGDDTATRQQFSLLC
jgi:hypothetical protein